MVVSFFYRLENPDIGKGDISNLSITTGPRQPLTLWCTDTHVHCRCTATLKKQIPAVDSNRPMTEGGGVSEWPATRTKTNNLVVDVCPQEKVLILGSFSSIWEFFPIISTFFPAIFQSSMFSYLCFYIIMENFMHSDWTPLYIDPYLQLFPNYGNNGKKTLRLEWALVWDIGSTRKSDIPCRSVVSHRVS